MKALRLYGKLDIRYEEVCEPAISPDEVLVNVKYAFICGTDVRMYKNGKENITPSSPLILGHEFSGIIDKVGAAVRNYTPGMRVTVAPNYGCGICDRCISGNNQLCRQSEAIGVTIDGGFAQKVRIPAKAVQQGNIMVVADHVSLEAAALVEPFSCVYNAYEKIGIYPGDTVLIIGAGPIGIMHAKIARLAGAARVIMNDLSADRLEQASRIDPAIETLQTDNLQKDIERITGGRGCDLVVTAASAAAIQEVAFSLAGMNGRVMFFGGLPAGKSVVNLDTNEIHYKQLTISGTSRQSLRQYRKILDLITGGVLTADDIITGRADPSECEEVMNNISAGVGLKTALEF